MTEKMVFFDIDGTLLNEKKVLPPSAKRAIQSLQEEGVYVAIATGRAPFMVSEIAAELAIQSFVSYNGQYVVFEGEEIFKKTLPKKELKSLITTATERRHPLAFSAKEEMCVNFSGHPAIEEGFRSLKQVYPRVDANFYENEDIYQCLLFCDESHDRFYAETFEQYGFMRWHKSSVDVCPADGSKARGLRYLIERLGVPLENTYAFGDGLNDIQMLKEVGVGIAMGNGREETKAVADFVTADVDDDGIAKALYHIGLLKNYSIH